MADFTPFQAVLTWLGIGAVSWAIIATMVWWLA
jgi:hypothetical protein